jgi:excisionase family DNA binding protein
VIAPSDLQPGTLSVKLAARRLGIGEATAYDLIRRGEFPVRVIQLGGRKKVSIGELEAFLAGERAAGERAS